MGQRPNGGRYWSCHQSFAGEQPRSVNTREPPHAYRFYVAFNSSNLAREKNSGKFAHLHRSLQNSWGANVGIAMDLAILQELRVFQTWYQANHPRLFAVT